MSYRRVQKKKKATNCCVRFWFTRHGPRISLPAQRVKRERRLLPLSPDTKNVTNLEIIPLWNLTTASMKMYFTNKKFQRMFEYVREQLHVVRFEWVSIARNCNITSEKFLSTLTVGYFLLSNGSSRDAKKRKTLKISTTISDTFNSLPNDQSILPSITGLQIFKFKQWEIYEGAQKYTKCQKSEVHFAARTNFHVDSAP